MNKRPLVLKDTGTYELLQSEDTMYVSSLTAASGPIRLANLTTTERDALTPVDGDTIYNSTDNQFQVYENGGWLSWSSGISSNTSSIVAIDLEDVCANDPETSYQITAGNFKTLGDYHCFSDSSKHYFGAGDDYQIYYDGTDARHYLIPGAGSYKFVNGAIGVPTMNTTDRDTWITSPYEGMLIYNLTENCLQVYIVYASATDAWENIDFGGSLTLDDVCDNGSTTDQTITAAGFVGPLTGNADTVTTNADLTGEVTSSGNAAVLDPTAISNKTDTTIDSADYLLFWDSTDSTLKKVDAGELIGSSTNLTGDVTSVGSVTTLDPTAISNKTAVTVLGSDYFLIYDATDGQLKKTIASNVLSSDDLDDVCDRGSTTNRTITADGGFITSGNIELTGDNDKIIFGTGDDFNITWDGTNGVYTITSGAHEFDGGPIRLPNLTTAQRDALTPSNGMMIYNTTTTEFQSYENGSWTTGSHTVVITTNTTIYVSTTGSDSTGNGTSASPYQTFDKALAVANTWILQANLTIDIEAGDYTSLESGALSLNHQQGSKLIIAADYVTDAPTLNATATDGSTYVDYTVTSSSASSYTVGDTVTCYNYSAGTNGQYTVGVLEVMSISGTSVRLRNIYSSTQASGSVVLSISIPQVKWDRQITIKNSVGRLTGIQNINTAASNQFLLYGLVSDASAVSVTHCIFYNTNATHYGYVLIKKSCDIGFTYCGFRGLNYGCYITQSACYAAYSVASDCAYGFRCYALGSITGSGLSIVGNTTGAYVSHMSIIARAGVNIAVWGNGTDRSPSYNTEGNYNSYMLF